MKSSSFDAQITAVVFDAEGAIFALGDGSVRFEGGEFSAAHDGAILCAVAHPSGNGAITGGDDGRLVWHRRTDAGVLATSAKGQWIDAVDASAESGLIAFSAGKTLTVLDAKDAGFRRDFQHERTVSGVALAEQKPTFLRWAGSHTAVTFSPDGAFVVTAMQDSQLHGWRLKDQKNMRMGGYPSKVRAFSFLSNGQLLATSGAQGAVLWPFVGANGPMGREATEIGFDEGSLVALVASQPKHGVLAAGLNDGRVWLADPAGQGLNFLKADRGAPITALAMSPDATRVAWADEDGNAGVSEAG
jgi:WD40 repeat protein